MSTYNQMIYDVRERLNQLNDDSEFSDRLILHRINQVRATFLLQHLNNFRIPTSLDIIQSLCLETELVSTEICGVAVDCEKILRTKQKLPQLLIKHTGPSIISVTTPNMFSEEITVIPFNKVSISQHKPFKSTNVFLGQDNHLYMFSSKSESYKFIECLTVKGVFYNPLDLEDFKNCCGCENSESCFDRDSTNYPMLAELESALLDVVVSSFQSKLELPKDNTNNSDDDR